MRRYPHSLLHLVDNPTSKRGDRLALLRRLLNDNVSLDTAWWVLNKRDGASPALVEALMYSLRERGPAALQEKDTKRRLSELDDQQLEEIEKRLQALKIGHCWTAAEVEVLVRLREELRQ